MRHILFASLLLLPAWPGHTAETDLELWRLDCGSINIRDLNMFSDTMSYTGQSKRLTDSCYLIRHDGEYLLWDTGLPLSAMESADNTDAPATPILETPLTDQLARINVTPDQISLLAISHNHFDHLGQAAEFPAAKLLIGAKDWAALQSATPLSGVDPSLVQPWLDGQDVLPITGDHDIFGDGSVVMLAMPGHTDGQTALLVNLAETGPVLLSADVAHFRLQLTNDEVPPINLNRAESLASMDRLRDMAETLNAPVVVAHDPDDITKLPVFPASAR